MITYLPRKVFHSPLLRVNLWNNGILLATPKCIVCFFKGQRTVHQGTKEKTHAIIRLNTWEGHNSSRERKKVSRGDLHMNYGTRENFPLSCPFLPFCWKLFFHPDVTLLSLLLSKIVPDIGQKEKKTFFAFQLVILFIFHFLLLMPCDTWTF